MRSLNDNFYSFVNCLHSKNARLNHRQKSLCIHISLPSYSLARCVVLSRLVWFMVWHCMRSATSVQWRMYALCLQLFILRKCRTSRQIIMWKRRWCYVCVFENVWNGIKWVVCGCWLSAAKGWARIHCVHVGFVVCQSTRMLLMWFLRGKAYRLPWLLSWLLPLFEHNTQLLLEIRQKCATVYVHFSCIRYIFMLAKHLASSLFAHVVSLSSNAAQVNERERCVLHATRRSPVSARDLWLF